MIVVALIILIKICHIRTTYLIEKIKTIALLKRV